MESWQAIVLGVIEGITEYLPISSTGHLLVASHVMGLDGRDELAKAASDAYSICIQGGAILAVLGLYYPRVLQMIRGVLGQDREGLKLAMSLLVGFLPAAVLGVLFNDWIEAKLFGMWPIVAAWIVGGVLILAAGWWKKRAAAKGGESAAVGIDLLQMTWKMALVIGLLQCVAMWPGTSRSLMTIVGGLMVGLSLKAAVEYSFLLGVLTLSAATVKKAIWPIKGLGEEFHHMGGGVLLMVHEYGVVAMLVGMVAAMVAAVVAVKWLVGYLQSHGLAVFGWYRIVLGLGVGTWLLVGR